MNSLLKRESCVVFNTADFQQSIEQLLTPFKEAFKKTTRHTVLFHCLFIFALSCELLFLGFFFSTLFQPLRLVLSFCGIFLTLFIYLVLVFYHQGRRSEKLANLCQQYLERASSSIPFAPHLLEYQECISEASLRLIGSLGIPPLTNRLILASDTLSYLVEKFRIWTQWKDLLKIKETLLLASIHKHIHFIKSAPSDLEAHAFLANHYVTLATLYQDPRKVALRDSLCFVPPEYMSEEMKKKFERALERALEEFYILDAYAPQDPWVYAQTASVYHKLRRHDLERVEYEKILKIDPQNSEILFRLGRLYFQKGENAQGLKTYDLLQEIDPEKATGLIAHYDAYTSHPLELKK